MADLVIDDALGRGLRPNSDLHRDPRYLREMLNQIPLGSRRSRTLQQVTYPLASPALSMSWPFPQILRDEKVVNYFAGTTFYTVSTSDFTATSRNVYSCLQNLSNRRFESSTGWTTGTGWAISGGVASATTATADLSQTSGNQAVTLVSAAVYLITYTITRSAGTVTPYLGATAGTARNLTGTYSEEITCPADNSTFKFTGAGFTGTVDNVSVVRRMTITGTDGWQMVAFQDRAWFACNATNFLYRLPTNPVDTTGTTAIMSGRPVLNVGAVGKDGNRLLLGGLTGSQLTKTFTADLFTYWRKNRTVDSLTDSTDTLDSSYILYSTPAGGDSAAPFYTLLAMLGIPGTDEATLFQRVLYAQIKSGQAGFFRPKYCGEIRNISQLGDSVIVYGKNGISRLTMTERGYREEVMYDQGIPSGASVAGDEDEHIFPSNAGTLHRIPKGGACVLLGPDEDSAVSGGYREFVTQMTLANIVACFDPLRRSAWFSDGSKCYCWTGYGLGESDAVQPSSLFRLANSTALYGTAITKDDPQTTRVVSSVLSSPDRTTFEISSLDVASIESDSTTWTATTDYRMRTSDAFKRGTPIDVPDRGRAYVKRTGLEQRAVLVAANYKEANVDSIAVNIGKGQPALTNLFAGTDTTVTESNV